MKRFNVTVNGKAYDVTVDEIAAGAAAPVTAAPAPAPAPVAAAAPAAAPAPAEASASAAPVSGATTIESPMPGTILDIKVSAGQTLAKNQVVAILEAMKMENEIVTPVAGTVAGIHVAKGDAVNTGTLLFSVS